VLTIRLAKEKVSYQQETDKQQQKIENMKAGGEDEYVIKKQVRNCASQVVQIAANLFFGLLLSCVYVT